MGSRKTIKKQNSRIKVGLSILIYIIVIHYLFLNKYAVMFRDNAYGNLFIYDFNLGKYLFCVVETLIIYWFVLKKVDISRFSESAVLILNLLYFIPGIVMQAVTNASWFYMIYYFSFWCGMEMWLKLIKPRKSSLLGNTIQITQNLDKYVLIITFFAVGTIIALAVYMGTFFSVSGLVDTLRDVYGVRAAAKEKSLHWLILTMEYWAAYYIIIAIAFYTQRRKWWIVVLLVLVEFNVFLLQANRIILFLTALSIIIGLFRVNNKFIASIVPIIAIVLLIEAFIFERGSMFNDIFRRYAINPNRLGEQYFDYFLSHTPDYLRTTYRRTALFFNFHSPYQDKAIGEIISEVYYGHAGNGNTGLVGGAMYQFGLVGALISTFDYIFAFRLFEGATYGIRKSNTIYALVVLLSTLSINMPGLLTSLFGISYIMLLYVSLLPLCKLQDNQFEYITSEDFTKRSLQ